MTILAFVLASPEVSATWLSQVAAAVSVQLARDVAPTWGLAWPDVDTRAYERVEEVPRGALPIVILPDSDVAGTIGYHEETAAGVPYARVFARGLSPADVSRTISHEAIEAMVDPSANRWAEGPRGLVYALEAVDPVDGEGYRIDVGGASVEVADFVLPSWFDPATPEDAPTDMLGRVKGPFWIGKSGYAIVRSPDARVETIPRSVGRTEAKLHPAARTARRLRQGRRTP